MGHALKGGRDNALVAETRFADQRIVLAFPITFMNDSGQAVSALVRRYRIESPEQIIVVQDELDFAARRAQGQGRWRARRPQRPALDQAAPEVDDFLRVRIGVGKPPSKEAGAGHVLSKVPKAERELLDMRVADAADAVEMIIADGVDAAMQRFNGKQ